MSRGPPYQPERPTGPDFDWREHSTLLEYPDREIRVLDMGFEGESPIEFGDFNPADDDPDPDVWPLEELDPGYPADVEDLILVTNSHPEPHAKWVTEEYLTERYGYNPVRVEVEVAVGNLPLPGNSTAPASETETQTVEGVATAETANPLTLTPDRKTALTRIANLWNGDAVRGHHLLGDKCPDWMDILGDLDQSELKRLLIDDKHDYPVAEAFGDTQWYGAEAEVYLRPTHVLRKKAWYDLAPKGRTLINKHDDLPDLRGDPHEGLTHRVTVGLMLFALANGERTIRTYADHADVVFDLLAESEIDTKIVEVITDHHNWQLHRDTYRKLERFERDDVSPIVVFDNRKTAYKVMNHWVNQGFGELPGGTFDSDYSVPVGREKVREAYNSAECDWVISDWATTSVLWRETLESADASTAQLAAIDW